ncbi:hypothetical protein [Mobilicoccus caccae]|uniref:Uncharacterized protein n=1 Tax=Mobilicoccus caccae TaxID=1859295 RepID=A0ABQ6ITB5_9MICO|nr:hypothetical protein [Mobilicoccus caccae]GMA40397.1 hypothetical protein GCM10025883_24420 [Mobilicoccus caccae]
MRSMLPVAGIDLGPVARTRADCFADDVVAEARSVGVDPGLLFVDTHRIITAAGDLHVVATISGAGAQEWQLWRMCSAVVRRHGALACTVGRHSVGDGHALVATRAAIDERLLRIAGRCVHFPGVESLVGTMTVGQIVEASAIEHVTEIGAPALDVTAEILTGGHVRPRWEFGTLTLHVQHEGQRLYRPFEVAPAAASH